MTNDLSHARDLIRRVDETVGLRRLRGQRVRLAHLHELQAHLRDCGIHGKTRGRRWKACAGRERQKQQSNSQFHCGSPCCAQRGTTEKALDVYCMPRGM